MRRLPTATKQHPFKRPDRWFNNIDAATGAALAETGSDVALVISPAGTIEDLTYNDPALTPFISDKWVGKRWDTTVTHECVDKIKGLLDDSDQQPITRRRQVNHPAAGLSDLPIDYAVVSMQGSKSKIALGNDLRRISEVQSRLVEAQLEMEHEYRVLRRAETRYRILFQLLTEPIAIVEGTTQKIIDLNLAAAKTINRPSIKASGESLTSLFAKPSRDAVSAAVSLAQREGTPRSVDAILNSTKQEVLLSVEPFRDDGQINLILRFQMRPSSTLEPFEPEDWNAESLLRNLPEAVVVTTAAGTIEEVNDQFLDFVYALGRESVVGRNLEDWLGASPVDMQVLMSNLRDRGVTRNFASILRDEYGGSRSIQVSAKRLTGKPDSSVGFLITESATGDTVAASKTRALSGNTSEMAELVGRVPLKELVQEASTIIERMCIEAALKQTKNNRASAADMLGLSRQSLYVKLKRHGLEQFIADD
ncbi:MAG: transcriptional regulator PpsR [Pseudomonadota bacterium]